MKQIGMKACTSQPVRIHLPIGALCLLSSHLNSLSGLLQSWAMLLRTADLQFGTRPVPSRVCLLGVMLQPAGKCRTLTELHTF